MATDFHRRTVSLMPFCLNCQCHMKDHERFWVRATWVPTEKKCVFTAAPTFFIDVHFLPRTSFLCTLVSDAIPDQRRKHRQCRSYVSMPCRCNFLPNFVFPFQNHFRKILRVWTRFQRLQNRFRTKSAVEAFIPDCIQNLFLIMFALHLKYNVWMHISLLMELVSYAYWACLLQPHYGIISKRCMQWNCTLIEETFPKVLFPASSVYFKSVHNFTFIIFKWMTTWQKRYKILY